eukprot:scaffold5717_cov173-Amphora_coffeaeformis.AAC.1
MTIMILKRLFLQLRDHRIVHASYQTINSLTTSTRNRNELLKALLVKRNPRAAVPVLLKMKSLHQSLNRKSTIQKGFLSLHFVLDDRLDLAINGTNRL